MKSPYSEYTRVLRQYEAKEYTDVTASYFNFVLIFLEKISHSYTTFFVFYQITFVLLKVRIIWK